MFRARQVGELNDEATAFAWLRRGRQMTNVEEKPNIQMTKAR
jgi:hypothetical protein